MGLREETGIPARLIVESCKIYSYIDYIMYKRMNFLQFVYGGKFNRTVSINQTFGN